MKKEINQNNTQTKVRINNLTARNRLSNYSSTSQMVRIVNSKGVVSFDLSNSFHELKSMVASPSYNKWGNADNSIYADTYRQIEGLRRSYNFCDNQSLNLVQINSHYIEFFLKLYKSIKKRFPMERVFIRKVSDPDYKEFEMYSINILTNSEDICGDSEKIYKLDELASKFAVKIFGKKLNNIVIDLEYY